MRGCNLKILTADASKQQKYLAKPSAYSEDASEAVSRRCCRLLIQGQKEASWLEYFRIWCFELNMWWVATFYVIANHTCSRRRLVFPKFRHNEHGASIGGKKKKTRVNENYEPLFHLRIWYELQANICLLLIRHTWCFLPVSGKSSSHVYPIQQSINDDMIIWIKYWSIISSPTKKFEDISLMWNWNLKTISLTYKFS